jgi:threonine dehydrogenase-like Zn-dependent dehydrogenase
MPEQVLNWAVQALAKAARLSIIRVYPPTQNQFPIGQVMNKNLTIKMGHCHHCKYIPHLLGHRFRHYRSGQDPHQD